MVSKSTFSSELIAWQRVHGRHGLPWQMSDQARDPYRVWLSEIMLQQTQVATVIGYYARFLQRFPDIQTLASASVDEVLTLWSGLGYYSRARNLHRAAQLVQMRFGGQFPRDPALLMELPGVGRSTAAAIAAFSYGVKAAILDGNVKRVLSRAFAITAPLSAKNDAALWTLAESLLPDNGIEAYTQGLMDLGATVCTRSKPLCAFCPLSATCMARAQGLQASLPLRLKKAAKEDGTAATRRTLHCYMLIAQAQEAILLERRPAVGIWAQLWSFPQFEALESLESQAAQLAGSHYDAASLQFLPTTKHSFSHYDLMIEPVRLTLPQQPSEVADPQAARWISEDALGTLGVPAVVGKLLALCK